MFQKAHPPRAYLLGNSRRSGRTARSLAAAGVAAIHKPSASELTAILRAGGPVLFVRAGAWLARGGPLEFPLPSATGKGLCALGAVRTPRETEPVTAQAAASWTQWLAETGGDLAANPEREFPESAILYLDEIATNALAQIGVTSLKEIVREAVHRFRLIHFPPLDVFDDSGLRVLQVITALQRGGAERVTLDLLAELPGQNVRTRLLTLGRALREAFPAPPGTLELSALTGRHESRGAALLRLAGAFGADVIHGHLITGDDARFLGAAGFPVVLTLHNLRPGWPAGVAELEKKDVALLAACAEAVEADARAAGIATPIRTVWNGIDLNSFTLTPELVAAGKRIRAEWGFGENDFVLLALANPRPQKRLDRLPPVLLALRDALARQGLAIEARLVIAGEAANASAEAQDCVQQTRAEISRLGLVSHVHWSGPVANPAPVLAAASVLVSTSAHEGLSLAQLEALAMGRPVVATGVGGAPEIARDHPAFYLVPSDASPLRFAQPLICLAEQSQLRANNSTHPRLDNAWSRTRMAQRYSRLYPRVIATARRAPGRGLWLIANNFSTGGAQSSARRLLLGLAQQGLRVRAAVIEENPANPTPGRSALLEAGIPVLAVDLAVSPGTESLDTILDALDADPPQSVLFWNLRPEFKVALADALLDIPVFDVSPGEMFFDSLDKYFARPHPGFPYRTARDYGARLAGVIVKFHAEAARAVGILGAPVHVIPNGVSLPERHATQNHVEHVVFGTAARINPQKRLEDLLEAFQLADDRLPPYTLKIAGGVEPGCDEYAQRLRAQAAGLPVEWLGDVDGMPAFHRDLDIFVMISEPAGCPNSSLEALAAGLPVIATDVGGASEQVITALSGCLVPPRDPKAFSEALIELALNPLQRRALGQGARCHIEKKFTVERMISDYRRVCLF